MSFRKLDELVPKKLNDSDCDSEEKLFILDLKWFFNNSPDFKFIFTLSSKILLSLSSRDTI